jgi:hypothetical protein
MIASDRNRTRNDTAILYFGRARRTNSLTSMARWCIANLTVPGVVEFSRALGKTLWVAVVPTRLPAADRDNAPSFANPSRVDRR